MSEATSNSKGPAPVQVTPEATEPTLIPADQVKPEDIGTLSLRYVDGVAQLVVRGGKYLPAGLTVSDESGSAAATYKAAVTVGDALQIVGIRDTQDTTCTGVEMFRLGRIDSPLIPATEVKPEDIAKLSIEYRDSRPVIVVSGGKYIPVGLTVVDGSGQSVAAYARSYTSMNETPVYSYYSYDSLSR